ncbi:hypothetical protein V6767_20255 [Martelella sp. FLE1502]
MEHETPASLIINKLGGLTKTARILSSDEKPFAVSTVQGWKERGQIPQAHWPALIEAAKAEGVNLTFPMFLGISEDAA